MEEGNLFSSGGGGGWWVVDGPTVPSAEIIHIISKMILADKRIKDHARLYVSSESVL
jgi:hypothetical protein